VVEEGESLPVSGQPQGGSVLSQSVDEVGWEQRGNLQKLVRKRESFSRTSIKAEKRVIV